MKQEKGNKQCLKERGGGYSMTFIKSNSNKYVDKQYLPVFESVLSFFDPGSFFPKLLLPHTVARNKHSIDRTLLDVIATKVTQRYCIFFSSLAIINVIVVLFKKNLESDRLTIINLNT